MFIFSVQKDVKAGIQFKYTNLQENRNLTSLLSVILKNIHKLIRKTLDLQKAETTYEKT